MAFAPFSHNKRLIYQDRLGSNTGKALKKRAAFSYSATITVDGTTLRLPDGLNAAVCLPGSNYSHDGPSGGCSDYVECELLGSADKSNKCRSFGADNVELHLATQQQSESDDDAAIIPAAAAGAAAGGGGGAAASGGRNETTMTRSKKGGSGGVIAVSYNASGGVGRAEVTLFERGPRLGPFH
jgi:hypothetical protein